MRSSRGSAGMSEPQVVNLGPYPVVVPRLFFTVPVFCKWQVKNLPHMIQETRKPGCGKPLVHCQTKVLRLAPENSLPRSNEDETHAPSLN
jgi:hypothetical protein